MNERRPVSTGGAAVSVDVVSDPETTVESAGAVSGIVGVDDGGAVCRRSGIERHVGPGGVGIWASTAASPGPSVPQHPHANARGARQAKRPGAHASRSNAT